MASRSKGSTAKLHEKHQVVLANLLREEDNKYCADCHAKGPRWASWNLGVFVCIRCAGIHRNLGVHISRMKSVNLDAWTPEQIDSIQKGGNKNAREIYEANLPANFRRPQDDYAVEVFIRSKYERKLYVDKQGGRVATGNVSTKSKDEKAKKDFLKVDRTDRKFSLAPSENKELTFMPRPASTPDLRSSSSTSPKARPRGMKTPAPPGKSTVPTIPKGTPTASKADKGANLMVIVDSPGASGTSPSPSSNSVDLLTGLPLTFTASTTTQEATKQPSLGPVQNQVKDSIMSLYSSQPQQASYTVQGMPINAYHYQQQQAAAMHMAHMHSQAQQRYQQVQQVQQQMEQLKLRQQHATPSGDIGGGGIGGQTLNPTLW